MEHNYVVLLNNSKKTKRNAVISEKCVSRNVEKLFDLDFISTEKTKSFVKYFQETTKRFGKKTKLRIFRQDNLERRQN